MLVNSDIDVFQVVVPGLEGVLQIRYQPMVILIEDPIHHHHVPLSMVSPYFQDYEVPRKQKRCADEH